MATNIGSLAVQITGNASPLTKELKRAESETQSFIGRMASGAGSAFSSVAGVVGNVFSGIKDALSSPTALIGGALTGFGLSALVVESVRLAAEVEDTQASFKVLLGDAGKAKELFNDIRKLAGETPLTSGGLSNLATSLAGAGISQDQIIPTLRILGDLAQGDEERLKGVANAYVQVRAKGKLAAEELNQFAERQVPLRPALAKVFNVTESELGNLIETGKVGFPDLQRAIRSLTSEGGTFFGLMAEKSKTFNGLLSSLKDNVQVLGANFGQALIEEFDLKPLIERVSIFAEQGGSSIDKIRPILRGLKDAATDFGTSLINVLANVGEGTLSFGESVIAQLRAIKSYKDDLIGARDWAAKYLNVTAGQGPDWTRYLGPGGGFHASKRLGEQFGDPEAAKEGSPSWAKEFRAAVMDFKKALAMPLEQLKAIQAGPPKLDLDKRGEENNFGASLREQMTDVAFQTLGAVFGESAGNTLASIVNNEFISRLGKKDFNIEPAKLNADQIKFGKNIREQMNPLEKFRNKIAEIQTIANLGGLNEKEKAFAIANVWKDVANDAKAAGQQFAGAMVAGSQEAASIRFREEYGQRGNKVEDILARIENLEKRQLENAIKQTQALEKAGLLKVK